MKNRQIVTTGTITSGYDARDRSVAWDDSNFYTNLPVGTKLMISIVEDKPIRTLKEVLKNPPMQTYQDRIPTPWNIDYNLWCRQVREAVSQGVRCDECGHPTGRDEVDALYIDDCGPFCLDCYTREWDEPTS